MPGARHSVTGACCPPIRVLVPCLRSLLRRRVLLLLFLNPIRCDSPENRSPGTVNHHKFVNPRYYQASLFIPPGGLLRKRIPRPTQIPGLKGQHCYDQLPFGKLRTLIISLCPITSVPPHDIIFIIVFIPFPTEIFIISGGTVGPVSDLHLTSMMLL